jgi:hypothetical protein
MLNKIITVILRTKAHRNFMDKIVILNATAKATHSKQSTFQSLTPRAVFEREA